MFVEDANTRSLQDVAVDGLTFLGTDLGRDSRLGSNYDGSLGLVWNGTQHAMTVVRTGSWDLTLQEVSPGGLAGTPRQLSGRSVDASNVRLEYIAGRYVASWEEHWGTYSPWKRFVAVVSP
jgi:hypothetical protein